MNIKSKEDGTCKFFPKAASETRWAARRDAVKSLVLSYDCFYNTLKEISEDRSEKPEIIAEARGYCKQLRKLQTGILTLFWYDILDRFYQTSLTLQDVSTTICDVVFLYQSLYDYVDNLRSLSFHNTYETEAKNKFSSCDDYYDTEATRLRKRKLPFGESHANDTTFTPSDHLRIDTVYAIIDRLKTELLKRKEAYAEVDALFGFLSKLPKSENDADLNKKIEEEIRTKARGLVQKYKDDLSFELVEECIHFRELVIRMNDDSKANSSELLLTPQQFMNLLRSRKLISTYLNLENALRIYLTILSANSTGERSFSRLKILKSSLRNSASQEKLNSEAIICLNPDIVQELNKQEIIDEFATLKARNMTM